MTRRNKVVKEAEKRVVAFAKHYGYYRHKYGDVRKCLHCQGLLPKTENAPDYAIAPIFTWIEAKNSAKSTGRWNWAEIGPEGARKNQRAWLIREGGWLFIELINIQEEGQVWADNRGAFLIPFKSWLKDVEPILLKLKMKSIRLDTKANRPGADSLLAQWALVWEPNVGWLPPAGHIWWTALAIRIHNELDKVEEMLCPTPQLNDKE